jgi:adenine-specific DNA-methyltransferase
MTPHNWWTYDEVGHTQEATKELAQILTASDEFDYPKPVRLINRILQIATEPDSIILDSFAGSGTTAHAVLNMNKQDNGNRKFILVEMMDYVETLLSG